MARLAAARGGRQSRPVADHVRHRRRAAADRMGSALAARLRRVEAGADRQRRPQQFQLDVYGEIMDAITRRAAAGCRPTTSGWDAQLAFLEHLEKIWQRARRGHLGGARRPAALHPFEGHGLGGLRPRDQERRDFRTGRAARRWRKLRDEICNEVCSKAFDPELGTFVQAYGTRIWMRACCCFRRSAFCRPTTRACEQTVAAIERRLLRDGLVMRYDTESRRRRPAAGRRRVPGLQFLAGRRLCAARPGGGCRAAVRPPARAAQRSRPAQRGIRPALKRQVGNFPQAFSHMALVNAAYNLTRLEKPVEQRAQLEYEPPEKAVE